MADQQTEDAIAAIREARQRFGALDAPYCYYDVNELLEQMQKRLQEATLMAREILGKMKSRSEKSYEPGELAEEYLRCVGAAQVLVLCLDDLRPAMSVPPITKSFIVPVFAVSHKCIKHLIVSFVFNHFHTI